MISKEDYLAWRQSAAFQEMEGSVLEAIEALGAELIRKTTSDPDRDQYVRGFIRGIQVMREWQPEFNEQQTDEVLDNDESEEA